VGVKDFSRGHFFAVEVVTRSAIMARRHYFHPLNRYVALIGQWTAHQHCDESKNSGVQNLCITPFRLLF